MQTENAVIEAVRTVEQSKVDHELRVVRRIQIGHAVQQGDVYIHAVPDNHPKGDQLSGNTDGGVQIALGTGNGARHMACGPVSVYAGRQLPVGCQIADVPPETLLGPVIVARDTWTLEHPEHAYHQLPAGVYQTTYQFDPRTMRRVQD